MNTQAKHLDPAYRSALLVSAVLNLVLLVIEGVVGISIGSAALLADAVDFLEDASVFGLAIIAVNWSRKARAVAGLTQGLAMAVVGVGAVVQIIYRLMMGGAPSGIPMASVAFLALMVNFYCAYRLVGFQRGDASMRAIWLSARNDALMNILTIASAGVIVVSGSAWPDIIAGTVIAGVNLWACAEVSSAALKEMRS